MGGRIMHQNNQLQTLVICCALGFGLGVAARAAALAAPQNVLAATGNHTVSISFDPVQNATGYSVYRRGLGQNPGQAVKLNSVPITAPTLLWADMGLTNDTPL